MIEEIQEWRLKLVIDAREIRNQEERSFIYTSLSEKLQSHDIIVVRSNLPLGDFLWVVQLKSFLIFYN